MRFVPVCVLSCEEGKVAFPFCPGTFVCEWNAYKITVRQLARLRGHVDFERRTFETQDKNEPFRERVDIFTYVCIPARTVFVWLISRMCFIFSVILVYSFLIGRDFLFTRASLT
jgi:hypothetical protein